MYNVKDTYVHVFFLWYNVYLSRTLDENYEEDRHNFFVLFVYFYPRGKAHKYSLFGLKVSCSSVYSSLCFYLHFLTLT